MTKEELLALPEQEYREHISKSRTVRDGLVAMAAAGYSNTPLGEATNLSPNDNYKEHGLFCRFEHCLRHMPTIPKELGAFNQVYGMMQCPATNCACPGGVVQVIKCFGKPANEAGDSKDIPGASAEVVSAPGKAGKKSVAKKNKTD